MLDGHIGHPQGAALIKPMKSLGYLRGELPAAGTEDSVDIETCWPGHRHSPTTRNPRHKEKFVADRRKKLVLRDINLFQYRSIIRLEANE
jgi:hypothetical protein